MQEEVENRTLTLVVSGTKFTGRPPKAAAVTKYMAHLKEKNCKAEKPGCACHSLTVSRPSRSLVGQNQGVSNIEIT